MHAVGSSRGLPIRWLFAAGPSGSCRDSLSLDRSVPRMKRSRAGRLFAAAHVVALSVMVRRAGRSGSTIRRPWRVSCGGQPSPGDRRRPVSGLPHVTQRSSGLAAGGGGVCVCPFPGLSACAARRFPQPASRCARPGTARDLSRPRATPSWCRLRRRSAFPLARWETSCPAGPAGWDIRSWDGYTVLRDIRELSTLTALLRDGHADASAERELRIRLRSLQIGDDREWSSF